jgi:primosomal protein N' (replication factor Y)
MSYEFSKYAAVILDAAIDKILDYGIPDSLLGQIKKGVCVEVPVRGHPRKGYVFSVKDKPYFQRVLPIFRVLNNEELISEELFKLAVWVANYYHVPITQTLKLMLPISIRKNIQPKQQLYVMRNQTKEHLRKYCETLRLKLPAQAAVIDEMLQVKKGILLSELLEKTKGSRSPIDSLVKKGYLLMHNMRFDCSPLVNEKYFLNKPKILNGSQGLALAKINNSLENRSFETHLLHGVTGSGKTEVYLQAIDKALSLGQGVIMLVPEISLTEQTIERFRSRFEERLAILHYRISHGERFETWHQIRRGERRIVIGARSAIFSPVPNLGLIIIDEEHEQTYKQNEESPCYNARDVAVMRGKINHATVVLGSATPSLESYFNTQIGKYTLSTLSHRPDASLQPKVTLVDMKEEYEKAKGFTILSDLLIEKIKQRCDLGEQTILFLNRRGYHTTLFCQKCGKIVLCHQCDIALTLHFENNQLICHLCGYIRSPPLNCQICLTPNLMKYRGIGTELLEKSLHAILSNIRSLRIDADTTRHKGSHQKLLRQFGTGKADVLIGTQMIAKGLHFPEVTLVGIINCDTGLNIPDFRASETTFQLITQVAGRAGRGFVPGEVILQTSMPENKVIQLAANQDYESFYQEEILSRKMFLFPPFSSIVKIGFSGIHQNCVSETTTLFHHTLLSFLPSDFIVNQPVPAGYAKVKGKYRFQFLIRGSNIYLINRAIQQTKQNITIPKQVRLAIDVNPSSTFF